jgi:hypothetical protein
MPCGAMQASSHISTTDIIFPLTRCRQSAFGPLGSSESRKRKLKEDLLIL